MMMMMMMNKTSKMKNAPINNKGVCLWHSSKRRIDRARQQGDHASINRYFEKKLKQNASRSAVAVFWTP